MFFRIPIPIPRSKPSAPSLSRWWDGRNGWWSPMYEVVHSPMIINHQPNIIHQLISSIHTIPIWYDVDGSSYKMRWFQFQEKIQSTSHEQFAQLNPVPAHPMPKFFGIDHPPTETNFSPSHIRIWCWWYSNMPLYSRGGWWNPHEKSMIGWINCYFWLKYPLVI